MRLPVPRAPETEKVMSQPVSEEEHLPMGCIDIKVAWYQIRCFGCEALFKVADFSPWTGDPDKAPGPLTLIRTGPVCWPPIFRATLGFPGDELDTLRLADAAGWRKVTLYGRTIYVCPKCRPARTCYEWERHLVGESLQEKVTRIERERE
jgi:hypothetical protein